MTATSAKSNLAQGFAQEAPRAIVWWAALGALVLALEIYVMGSWVLSEDFKPSPIGNDPVPAFTLYAIRFFEVAFACCFVAVSWWAWRTCKRDGRLSLEAIIWIAWATAWWEDPISLWSRVNFFYNAHTVNFGNWTAHIPGWVNPSSKLLPEPIFFAGFAYASWFVWASLLASWSMSWAKRRFPSMGTMALIAWGLGTLMLFDLIFEGGWVLAGVYAYPLVHQDWSLWAGKTYQFPIYEALLWGPVWAAPGILYYFRDDKGHTILDRGIDRVKSVRVRPWLRILAMVAFINLVFQFYNITWTFIGMTADQIPADYPSHLRAGQCGEGSAYKCGGPDYHIPLPDSKIDPMQRVEPDVH